ncbi:hypothetical protein M3Y99_01217000 [Aphelenchoides fujianensis]|nr:hypothetical protein M3Y99_01217000 [Aphelenchoides fujianensis]
MTALYVEKSFGISECVFQTKRMMEVVCNFEEKFGSISSTRSLRRPLRASSSIPTNPYTCSPNYADFSYKKGQLALRILESKLGREFFFKVLHRILLLANGLSVDSFSHEIACVTGREFPFFFEMFVHQGGHAQFDITSTGKVSRHDLRRHSKGRRQSRKKVVISTGEEVSIDMTGIDPNSPILWIRVDPEMQLIRKVSISQPETHNVLLNTLMNENFFYPVRVQAALEAADIAGQLPEGLYAGLHPLVAYFQRHFGSASNPHLPRAIARLRHGGKCPQRVFGFLMALLKFNDNSANRYSDDHYRAFLIGALLTSVTPTEGARMKSKEERFRSKQVAMVEEKILQMDGHMMTDTAVFWAFAKAQGTFSEVRITALGCLINLVHCTPQLPFVDTIEQMLDLLVEDPNLQIRHAIGRLLVEKPPFRYERDVVASFNFASNHGRLAAKLWSLIGDLSMTPLVLLPDEEVEELAAVQRDLNGFDDANQ